MGSHRQQPLQEAFGLLRGVGLDAQSVHDLHVMLGLRRLVEIEGAGELLQVDDVGQVTLGEAQDAERPAGGRVPAAFERNDLQR